MKPAQAAAIAVAGFLAMLLINEGALGRLLFLSWRNVASATLLYLGLSAGIAALLATGRWPRMVLAAGWFAAAPGLAALGWLCAAVLVAVGRDLNSGHMDRWPSPLEIWLLSAGPVIYAYGFAATVIVRAMVRAVTAGDDRRAETRRAAIAIAWIATIPGSVGLLGLALALGDAVWGLGCEPLAAFRMTCPPFSWPGGVLQASGHAALTWFPATLIPMIFAVAFPIARLMIRRGAAA